MIVFGSIAILEFEKGEETNINNAEDALWWSFVTITTVGYGDKYPVTTEGRIVAGVLMIVGVGLFGTFTGFVASWFLNDNENKDIELPNKQDIYNKIEKIHSDIIECVS